MEYNTTYIAIGLVVTFMATAWFIIIAILHASPRPSVFDIVIMLIFSPIVGSVVIIRYLYMGGEYLVKAIQKYM